MINTDGTPREKLFIEDGLHFIKKGVQSMVRCIKALPFEINNYDLLQ